MGYGHSWKIGSEINSLSPKELKDEFAIAVYEIVKLYKALPKDIKIGDSYGSGKPKFTKSAIEFNGVGDESHESFNFYLRELEEGESNSIKTNHNPYDLFVQLSLLALKNNITGFKINTDGRESDWDKAKEIYKNVTGINVSSIIENKKMKKLELIGLIRESIQDIESKKNAEIKSKLIECKRRLVTFGKKYGTEDEVIKESNKITKSELVNLIKEAIGKNKNKLSDSDVIQAKESFKQIKKDTNNLLSDLRKRYL